MRFFISALVWLINFPYGISGESKKYNNSLFSEINYLVDYGHTKDSVPTFRGMP